MYKLSFVWFQVPPPSAVAAKTPGAEESVSSGAEPKEGPPVVGMYSPTRPTVEGARTSFSLEEASEEVGM